MSYRLSKADSKQNSASLGAAMRRMLPLVAEEKRHITIALVAVLLTSGNAQTMPPFIPFIIGEGGQDWPAVAAATTLFVIPILVFTILLRKHLLLTKRMQKKASN